MPLLEKTEEKNLRGYFLPHPAGQSNILARYFQEGEGKM